MKMKKPRKLTVLIIAAYMLLTLIPNMSFADNNEGYDQENPELVYEEPAYEEPAYEEPAYEEPAYEEPALEEPIVDGPAFEEPVIEVSELAEAVAVQAPPPEPEAAIAVNNTLWNDVEVATFRNCDIGFHCRDISEGSGGPSQKISNYSKKDVQYFGQIEPGLWILLAVIKDEPGNIISYEINRDYKCPKCGSTTWVTYSNQSDNWIGAVFDGKNIQVNHYGGGLTYSGEASIQKYILTNYGYDIAKGGLFKFNLYKISGAREEYVGTYSTDALTGKVSVKNLELGQYIFREVKQDGWELINYKDGVKFEIVADPGSPGNTKTVYEINDIFKLDIPVVVNKTVDLLGSLEVTVDVNWKYDVYQPLWQKEIQPLWQKTVQPMWQKEIQPWWQKEIQPWWQKEIQPWWQKEIQPWWQKEIQPVWQKEIQPWWQKEIQPVWQKEIQPWWQKVYQPYQVPVFEKKVSSESGTLVSGITSGYQGGGLPGGYLGNGMTYLTIDVNKYTQANPLKVWIADSSKNNGNKGPGEYNKNIEYFYTLYCKDGNLYINIGDERLISANFGVLVDSKPFNGNPASNIKHDNKGVVALPKNASTVYVFFHMENVKWYKSGEYEFVGWRTSRTVEISDEWVRDEVVKDALVRNDVVDDYFVRDEVVKNAWVRDEIVSDVWVRDDVIKDAWVRDEVVKDAWVRDEVLNEVWVRDDVVKDAWVRDEIIKDVWVRDEVVKNAWVRDEKVNTITEPYPYDLFLQVMGPDGFFESCILNTGGSWSRSGLAPGEYTCVLFADVRHVKDVSAYVSGISGYVPPFPYAVIDVAVVTVPAGGTIKQAFNNTFDTFDKYLEKTYLNDKVLEKVYLKDIELEKAYLEDKVLGKKYLADKVLAKKYLEDKILVKKYLEDKLLAKKYLEDNILDKKYLEDKILVKKYLENKVLDKIYLEDKILVKKYLAAIFLPAIKECDECSETDPNHIHAIRLN